MSSPGRSEHQHLPRGWLDRIGPVVRAYFYSGWAFFIPYLLAYLLYASLKLPVNPGAMTDGRYRSAIPSLLTIYWTLHVSHLLLASISLRSWSRQRLANVAVSHSPSRLSFLWPLLPWICLALLFCIPGIYLEWPSDAWEHLSRITEWGRIEIISDHRTPAKFGYSLFYSILGLFPTGYWSIILTSFSSFGALLLTWSFYRLAREALPSPRWSFIAATTCAILLGNTCFAFVRYYGLSTSVLAQSALVAFIGNLIRSFRAVSDNGGQRRLRLGHRIATGFGTCFVMTANHVQTLPMALIFVLAVAGWAVVESRRSRLWQICGVMIAAAVLTASFAPIPKAITTYCIPNGWMTNWYGFAVLSMGGPAAERAWVIMGLAGVLSLGAAAILASRNHVIAWLTLAPVVALVWPPFAIAFSAALASRGEPAAHIHTFHRMLLALPVGLSIVTLIYDRFNNCRPSVNGARHDCRSTQVEFCSRAGPPLLGLLALLLFVGSPTTAILSSRFWHLLTVTPRDLNMCNVRPATQGKALDSGGTVIANTGTSWVLFSYGHVHLAHAKRLNSGPMSSSPARSAATTVSELNERAALQVPFQVVLDDWKRSFSPGSNAADLSRHWIRSETALTSTAALEMRKSLAALQQRGLGVKSIESTPAIDILQVSQPEAR